MQAPSGHPLSGAIRRNEKMSTEPNQLLDLMHPAALPLSLPSQFCPRKEMYMSTTMIIRAWKDEEFRQSLSEAELALRPDNPAGLLELSDEELALVAGGAKKKAVKKAKKKKQSSRSNSRSRS
jgi:mersacidin/lichenicidin family type 2 lantibiotic